EYRDSTGKPSPIAQGIATITLVTDNDSIQNNENDDPIVLVDGSLVVEAGSDEAVKHVFGDFDSDNSLKALFFVQRDRSQFSEDNMCIMLCHSFSPSLYSNDSQCILILLRV